MLSIYELKPRFQNFLRPLVKKLTSLGISPNQVTIFTCAISILVGEVLYIFRYSLGLFALLPIWLFLRMALNAIDGMLAKEHNKKTPLGAILNELTDVLSDVALYLPFAVLYPPASLLAILVVIFSVISEMTGLMALSVGAARRYDGPMGKSDRAFIFGAMGLALSLGLMPGGWLSLLFLIILCLLMVTIFNRARSALREAKI